VRITDVPSETRFENLLSTSLQHFVLSRIKRNEIQAHLFLVEFLLTGRIKQNAYFATLLQVSLTLFGVTGLDSTNEPASVRKI
jgi:hypothetical protein